MNERDNFALVPKLPASLEKAKPGVKRIVSSMVADTLALAKEGPPRSQRSLRIVSVDDEPMRLEFVEVIVSGYFKGVTVQSFRDAEDSWQVLSRTDPDLLITDDLMGKLTGEDIVRRLADRKVAYPIIVINGYGPERDQWVLDCAKRGVNVTMLRAPFSVESLARAVESGLKISRDAAGPVQVTAALASSVDAEALLQRGKNFYFGCGVSENYAEAFALFSKAAGAGHPEAQFHVALCFEDGDGVKPDEVQAAAWYLKSAIGGFAKAQHNLAICYRDGHGVPQDYAQANKWFRMAVERGYAPASNRPKNESGYWLKAERGDSLILQDKSPEMGFYYRYKFGHGAPYDGVAAVEWYRTEAERGGADAQTNLGVCYELGHGVPQDYVEAARWYRMAAEQECANAQNKLIVGIQSCRIVPLDSDEKEKWYLREEASRGFNSWWKKARWGEASGQFSLGFFYEKGCGVPQDIIEAYKWFKLAAAHDYKTAPKNSKTVAKKVTSLLSTMTPDQIQEGERRFREFKIGC